MTPHGRREPANRLEEITARNARQWQINRIQDSHKALLTEAPGASRETGGRGRERPGGILGQLQGAFRRVFRLRPGSRERDQTLSREAASLSGEAPRTECRAHYHLGQRLRICVGRRALLYCRMLELEYGRMQGPPQG
jgi:hypothetical protein